MFSQTQLQSELIQRLDEIDHAGRGKHKRRSVNAALKAARMALGKQGYTESEAEAIIREARDMHELNKVCDDEVD